MKATYFQPKANLFSSSDCNLDCNINTTYFQPKNNIAKIIFLLLFFYFLEIFWKKIAYSNSGNNVALRSICQHESNMSGGGVKVMAWRSTCTSLTVIFCKDNSTRCTYSIVESIESIEEVGLKY